MRRKLFVSALSVMVFALATSCSGFRSPPRDFLAKDGRYDNNNFLVNSGRMNLSRIIESVHLIQTEAWFRIKENEKIVKMTLTGVGVVLYGKYFLTVEHVTSPNKVITIGTPFGRIQIEAEKLDERTFLKHDGKSHPLERIVINKGVDFALFRLPEDLVLNSFPYRLGDSNELRVGNFVYIIGDPHSFGINTREGIVSSLRAPMEVSGTGSNAENAFMVSNGLNPGDSGGTVIAIRDGEFELVGIAQGSFTSSQRMGWVIRFNVIRDLMLKAKEVPDEFKEFLKNE